MNIPKFSKIYQPVINDIISTARDNDIRIRISKGKKVYAPGDKLGCPGYFYADNKELAIALSDTSEVPLLSLFIHESCHMDQYLQDRPLWDKCSVGCEVFYDWLAKKRELSDEDLFKNVQATIALELDCEKRSIQKIKKYKLPINVDEYKRNSNTYLYGLLYCTEMRKWFTGIYCHPEIYNSAPFRFQRKYTVIPKQLHEAFKKHVHS